MRERCTPRPGEQPASKARRSDASGSLKIEFVNHASFVCETNGLRIISDPWLDGMAFNNGWALLSPTKFSYEDFRNITHIWISHEHPDHFSPPNLKKIPESCRERITILFQETKDKRVVNFLRSIGFSNFIDLPSDRWVELKPGVEVLCAPIEAGWGEGDSWMCLKTPEATLLNINDCDMSSARQVEEIANRVGKVDFLATQFSYASRLGNKEDVAARRAQAREVMDRLLMQIEVFRPSYVMPFASFVWFCHEENQYLNFEMNKIGDVAREIREKSKAIRAGLRGAHWAEPGTPSTHANREFRRSSGGESQIHRLDRSTGQSLSDPTLPRQCVFQAPLAPQRPRECLASLFAPHPN